MADIAPNSNPINDIEVAAGAPVSEALMAKMGANINGLLLSVLPVGMEIAGYLTELQLHEEAGNSNWWLQDGRSCIGTRYHAITGNTNIPDHRGVFGRGKNNGRSDGKQDPDGERDLGTYQADAFKAHDHGGGDHTHGIATATDAGGTSHRYRVGNAPHSTQYGTNASGRTILEQGGSDTRGKNVAKNYFIRVN